jgi:pyruvate,water dikinase
MAEFISKHGHRSVMEAEPAALSWAEDLPAVYGMMRNYLHAEPSSDPRAIGERQRHEREAATKDAKRRLRFWQKPIFNNTLGQAQKWVVMREHTKSLMVRGIDRGRRITRELARRLVARRALDDVFDLYYLTIDETKSLTRGQLDSNEARVRIARRKKEEERNKLVALPETFQGRPKPLRADQQPLPEGRILRGIPVSPGRVTGRARVIFDPRRDAAIEPGEILVAPVTDAGWTPLFVAASGIVVDVGGSLSHGSTVAREYGLPAVVNVKHGTRMIRNGQMITVDGTLGIVILEDG